MNNEIVIFTDGDVNIEVQINPEEETVWLTQKQMGELFDVKQATLSEHINKIIMSGELDETSIGFSDKRTGGKFHCTFQWTNISIMVQIKHTSEYSFHSSSSFNRSYIHSNRIHWQTRYIYHLPIPCNHHQC